MPKKQGVVVFDFDGVIGDSVKECFVQSIKAYSDVGGKLGASREVEKKFREARPLITKAEHFFTVMRLIEQNPKIQFSALPQAVFNAEIKKDTTASASFKERFYAGRKEMRAISPREWLALQKSFPRIARFIGKLQAGNRIFIATTKDRNSVVALLKRYGIGIPEQRILPLEFSLDKKKQLEEIAQRAGVPLKQMVLVEDSIEQARAAREIGVKAVLVRWGYSSQIQRKQAKRERIPIIMGKRGAAPRETKKIARILRRARK